MAGLHHKCGDCKFISKEHHKNDFIGNKEFYYCEYPTVPKAYRWYKHIFHLVYKDEMTDCECFEKLEKISA